MKKSVNWQLVQTGLIVALVVVNTPRGPAIDAAHARNALIFRLAVTLVALVGVPITWKMIKKTQAAEKAAAAVAVGDTVEEIQYQSTPAALWRCNLHGFQRPKFLAVVLVPTLLLSASEAATLQDSSLVFKIFMFLTMSVVSSLGLAAFLLLVLWLFLRSLKPSGSSPRVTKTTLTRTAVVDSTPERQTIIPWREVAEIRHHQGDIYFWASNSGCFIPREAFADPRSALRFFETARQLWQEGKLAATAKAA
ncbi:MAG TPA: hypothetical protein VH394_13090 [Thermoanaerobaculia bacterium]|nr:hypothetical protein [Thermoanaerobaculia bacterium]